MYRGEAFPAIRYTDSMHRWLTWFDARAALVVTRIPAWCMPVMRFATFMGYPAVISVLAAIGIIISLKVDLPAIAIAQAASLVILASNTAIKRSVRRNRPDTLYARNMRIKSYSFPSGHACGAAVYFGLLAYLFFGYITLALIALILIIGTSRVYLGAHFPSDVVMGWLLGASGLMCIVTILQL